MSSDAGSASGRAWLAAPILFVAALIALALVWLIMEPEALHRAFDQDGYSPFELATLPFYAAIIPLVWWKCPFTGSAGRKALLCSAVSCVAFMAVVKETDLHLAAMRYLYPDVVAGFKGTPFKMRFLTSGAVPIGAKVVALSYFVLFFGVFGVTLAAFFPKLIKGIFSFNPAAWSMACFGASGVMVQLCDRMPAWIRHLRGLPKSDVVDATGSFFTAFEEGGEMMIAIFALLAILQAHALYAPKRDA